VTPVVAGKPNEPMAALVRSRLGPDGTMVGDRPDTDGRFARTLGYRWALVLSGVTRRGDLPVDPAPDVVAGDLAELVSGGG
jgi:ribonucleotide monophosphatase NagD (HAD superfamily)